VAFPETSLLDEAIGQFQKVVKGAGSRRFGSSFLQGCTLFTSGFMDKGMPTLEAEWHSRSLEAPDPRDKANRALYCDLGIAVESAENPTAASGEFIEVGRQNTGCRDVAE